MDLKTLLIKVLPNVKNMLIDRGYSAEILPNMEYSNIVEYKIDLYIESEKNGNRILDVFVNNTETKDYVFFYKGNPDGYKLNKVFIKKIKSYIRDITDLKGINSNIDNITFILLDKKIDQNDQPMINNFESKHSHIRIFDYHKFLFNLTAHYLVPKHRVYRQSYKSLVNRLMIDSLDKLPFILYNDPIARHFNLRDNEIVEIDRKTLGKTLKVYRVCKNFNYSYIDYSNTSGATKSKDYRIALTFGDAGENHVGMEMVGELGEIGSGFTTEELQKAESTLNEQDISAEYHSFDRDGEEAGILIIRNYLNDDEHTGLLTDMNSFEWDTKYWDTRRSKVLNKLARSNIVILDDKEQSPNYEKKKGRIVDGNKLPTFKKIKKNIVSLINSSTGTKKANKLICEGNRYYDLKKCGIGYHGDAERRKVIALSLGSSTKMNWQWFKNSKPVGDPIKFIINGGDIYIMSEKAVGHDWKKRSELTLRHAAGANKYICLNKYTKKSEDEEKFDEVAELKPDEKETEETSDEEEVVEETTGDEETSSEEEDEESSPELDLEDMEKIEWDDETCLQFYSDSKETDDFSKEELRYLSNFHKFGGKGYIKIDSNRYTTVEHYYQAQKFLPKYHPGLDADKTEALNNEFEKFLLGGEYDDDSKLENKWGLSARSKGGKTAMKKSGFVDFEIDNWNIEKLVIMKTVIKKRLNQDKEFKKILKKVKSLNKKLFHFERTGKYWGGNRPAKFDKKYWIGENKLGEIINELVNKPKKVFKKK